MSDHADWDIEKHRDEHESDEHWELRRRFMELWKNDYPQKRLVCLARVFVNMELLGCQYPTEVMEEVARLSHNIAKDYRNARKDKLKRTFVSASDAAEDRAKGVKRQGGIIVDAPPSKTAKYGIQFVKPGYSENSQEETSNKDDNSSETSKTVGQLESKGNQQQHDGSQSNSHDSDKMLDSFLVEMQDIPCLDMSAFNDAMFHTEFGRIVLLVRPWTGKLSNIQASCQACGLPMEMTSKDGLYSFSINGQMVAQACGTKSEAKNIMESMAWDRLRASVISVVVKELFIAQGDARISARDVAGPARSEFGAPVEMSVAAKMMKMMGWQGGGLGAAAQGIAEPIKPNFQMINRAGLGSEDSDLRALRRSSQQLMQRYKESDTLDVDLVFSAEFSKEERALLHQTAQRAGLVSRSYGKDVDRFLVVRKKLDPFSLVRAVLEKGGNTQKYQVFIPAVLRYKR